MTRAGPAVVGIGQRDPRQRRRHRRRPRPDQRPQPPRRRGHRHLPRRPDRPSARSSASIPTATSRSSRSTRPAPRPLGWSDAEAGDRRRRLRPRRRPAPARPGSRAGTVSRDRADVPRPRRQPDRRQPRAHGAAGPGLVRRPARRRQRRGSSRSTRTGSARASTWPVPPTPRCASGSTPCRAASRSSRPRLGIAIAPSAVARACAARSG